MYIPIEIQKIIVSYLFTCSNCKKLCIYKKENVCYLCKKFWCIKCNNCVVNKYLTTYVPCCYLCRYESNNLYKPKISNWLTNYNYYNKN